MALIVRFRKPSETTQPTAPMLDPPSEANENELPPIVA
jgi:hypothetical protein